MHSAAPGARQCHGRSIAPDRSAATQGYLPGARQRAIVRGDRSPIPSRSSFTGCLNARNERSITPPPPHGIGDRSPIPVDHPFRVTHAPPVSACLCTLAGPCCRRSRLSVQGHVQACLQTVAWPRCGSVDQLGLYGRVRVGPKNSWPSRMMGERTRPGRPDCALLA